MLILMWIKLEFCTIVLSCLWQKLNIDETKGGVERGGGFKNSQDATSYSIRQKEYLSNQGFGIYKLALQCSYRF